VVWPEEAPGEDRITGKQSSSQLTLCGLAKPYDGRGFVGPKKEDDCGPLSIQSSLAPTLNIRSLAPTLCVKTENWQKIHMLSNNRLHGYSHKLN
jgi:hypothetical protein